MVRLSEIRGSGRSLRDTMRCLKALLIYAKLLLKPRVKEVPNKRRNRPKRVFNMTVEMIE